ncbi:VWD domain-containing protein [Mesorhizobium sp. LjRoot246]|uniref:VWD domain-containing protein n=1 Tax=Mesorhizobium sp. LjRoot246 TaxID=3342294 RepID=UPI003ECFA83D
MKSRVLTATAVLLLIGVSVYAFTALKVAPDAAGPMPAAPPVASSTAPATPKPALPAAPTAIERDMNDPLNWPVTVPLGPDGNALPNTTRKTQYLGPSRLLLASLPVLTVVETRPIILARGPVRLGTAGPGWHDIQHPPQSGGSGPSYGASPGGGKSQSGSGSTNVWNGDGSFDSWDKDGHTHLDPPGPDGSLSGYTEPNNGGGKTSMSIDPDGGSTAWLPNGNIEVADPDGGKIIYHHDDGSIERISPGGERTIDLDPPPPPAGKGASNGIGEPHFQTFDGTSFSTQAVGEFTLAHGISGQDLQVRFQPYRDSRSASAVTGLAARAGGAVVQILLDGSVLVDGAPASDRSPTQYDLPDGGAIGVWRENGKLLHAVLVWPDLSTLWVSRHDGYLNFSMQWRTSDAARQGLLGRDDRNPDNDLTGRDGVVAKPSDDNAVKSFVDSWRVTDEESLFSYDEAESTETFTDRNFPYELPKLTHRDLADVACVALTGVFARKACLFDVAATGNGDFAKSALDAERRAATLKDQDAGNAAAPAAQTQVEGDCASAGDDIAAAEALDGDSLSVTPTSGASRIYILETSRGVTIQTRADDVVAGGYEAGKPGYCVFDKDKKTVIPLTRSNSDSYFSRHDSADLAAGAYYLKVVGNGESNLNIILNQ